MPNHPNRDKLTPLCQKWLSYIREGTATGGGLPCHTYMSGSRNDIRAVDRLTALGLVERVPYNSDDPTPRVRAVAAKEACDANHR